MISTLDEFLSTTNRPHSVYIDCPGFASFYARKGDTAVIIHHTSYRLTKVFTAASAVAEKPGQGAFTRLVIDLVQRGYAVLAECVHNKRFIGKLLRMGFIQLDCEGGAPSFIFNQKGHLTKWE